MKNAALRPSAETVSKVAVLVLGMHRSGTSALAGILHNLGCVGPLNPVPGNQWNAEGFFESLPIYKLGDDILAAAGSKWNDWLPLNPGWQDGPRFSEFRSRARDLVASEYGTGSLIYLKDPRICRLLPFWTEVLEGLGFRVLHVGIHRNPVDVAESLHTRDRLDRGLATLIWLRHVLDAEAASRGRPRIFTAYDSILHDWAGFAHKSEEAFGFVWPRQSQKAARDIQKLLSPGLRHHNTDKAAILDSPLASDIVKDTLRIFDTWARDGESAADHPRLDAIRAQLDLCAPLFGDALISLETDARSNAARLARVNEAVREAASLRAGAAVAANAELNAAEEVKWLSTTLSAAMSARDEASGKAEAMAARLADLEERQRVADAALDAESAARADLATQLERATTEMAALSREVIVATDRLIDRDKAAMTSRQTIAKLEGEIVRSARAIEAERAKLPALQESKARAVEALQQRHARAVEALQQRHALALEKLRQSFVQSTSWRLSAPVRALGGLLKGGRRTSRKRS